MAVATVAFNSEGRTGALTVPSLAKLTVTASSTGYLTAWGGLPFDMAAVLNAIGPFSAPINPADVVDLIMTTTTNGYIVKGLTFGRATLASDGTVSAGSTAFSSAATTFTSADTGYSISIPGAGPGGSTLVTTMTYVSAHAVTLGTAASVAVTTALCLIQCPTYTTQTGIGTAGTRVDANARPALVLATCPATVRLYGVVTGTPGVATTEFSDGANSDSFTAQFIINRGGANL